jgi:hypothetical protein
VDREPAEEISRSLYRIAHVMELSAMAKLQEDPTSKVEWAEGVCEECESQMIELGDCKVTCWCCGHEDEVTP